MSRSAGHSTNEVEIEGRRLRLTNLDKEIYPDAGTTKAGVIDYYREIADFILPHLRGRPLTLKRYPNGVRQDYFYEKRCPPHRPDWVETVTVPSSRSREGSVSYCLANDVPTLIWLANLAALELHPLLALSSDVGAPTVLVFDLDPGAPASLLDCARVALWLRESLEALALDSAVKTSGSKGLQVYVPLNTAHTYEQTKSFAHAMAGLLEKNHPELVVQKMDKSLRPGKVLVDWSQNSATKTTVCVYSLRATERPRVSTPVTWDEVEAALSREDEGTVTFEAAQVVERVKRRGDLFASVPTCEQRLPRL